MKRFTIPCNFGGAKAPFDVYIGHPKKGNHPLQNQATWLSSERGGTIPADIMESFAKLLEMAERNDVSFEDLCVYAMKAAEEDSKNKKVAPPEASPNPDSSPTPE